MSLDMSARQKLTESLLTDHPLAQAIALLKRAKNHLNHSSVLAQDLSTEISEFTAAYERKEQQS
ncbi:hypothetical protein E8F20_06025 [Pseudomonas sp. BN415]|uniref:hypothetical protein n=1 Tax=Pseudomonas sp. BN415 TaxID=2567889 RepID=UPI0024562688|nr:hypothetical protein [Pseudomonas sp. BN415]MDH4581433.1 hypothetical protein [Pseudomonas sp. BN415]